MIHTMLVQNGFIPRTVNARTVQRFLGASYLKSSKNPNINDLRAFEGPDLDVCNKQIPVTFLASLLTRPVLIC